MFQVKDKENQNVFYETLLVYEIMWENMIEPERLQTKYYDANCLHAG